MFKIKNRTIKRVLIKCLIFLIILSISVPVMSKKKERRVEAAFVIDDVLVGYVVAGVCLSLGVMGASVAESPTDIFSDMFGPYAIDSIRDYFEETDESKATDYLSRFSQSFRNAVTLVKKEHKHAVVRDAAGYKYIDESGNVVVTDMELPFSSGTYYYTDTLPVSDPAYTSGGKISKETLDAIKESVSVLKKPVVKLGKTILDDIIDFVGEAGDFAKNGTDSVAAIPHNLEILSRYSDKTALVIYGGYCVSYDYSDVSAIAIDGMILELRLADGSRVYGTMDVDTFTQRNDSYSKSGNISCFTDFMSSSLLLGGRGYSYANCCSDMLWGAYTDSIPSVIGIEFRGGQTCFKYTSALSSDGKGNYVYPPYQTYASIDSGAATFINNGLTGNYVIGQVASDGTIDYSIYGETTEGKYIDGLDIGSTSVKVIGDVTVSDRILEQVMDNSLTVEDINSEIAGISDNVIEVDNTVSDGFDKSNSWLEKIWGAVTAIPSGIASLFSSLWEWLRSILEAIKSVPGGIIAAVRTVGEYVLDVPGKIVSAVSTVGGYVLDIPSKVAESILEISDEIGDFVVSIPGAVTDTICDIGTTLKAVPSAVLSGLERLLVKLFVPSDNFFGNWGNKFKNSLNNKLPVDVFTDFMNDIKDITSSRAENVTMTIYGKKVTVLSFDWYYKCKDDIDNIIKGCTFVLLIFYNINMVYFAIRGTKLFNLSSFEGDLYYIQQNSDKIL